MGDSLKTLGFIPADEIKPSGRIIMSIEGLDKQGKTHFGLSAPGPIAMFSTDIGEEGVINKFTAGKKIHVMHVDRVDDNPAEQASAEFDRFKKGYQFVLNSKEIRTILIDTATEIWELLRMARFGRLTQVMPYQYGPVNAEYRALIRDAYRYDKNLILLHKMKIKYINDKRTGDYERSGFADTGFLVQVNAQVYRYDDGDFAIFIRNCRTKPELAGEEFLGPMCNWDFISEMIGG